MMGLSDVAASIAHALIFFSTIGCIVYGLVCWNKQEETVPMKVEKE